MANWPVESIEDCLERLSSRAPTKLQTKEYHTSGTYPIIDQGQAPIAGWTDDDAGLISAGLPVIVFGDHTRALKYVDFPFVRGADGTQILKPKPGIDPRFFYYACRGMEVPSRGYNRHFKSLKEMSIPMPPIDEQRDISRALQSVDEALNLQEKAVKTSANAKSAAMRAILERGLRGEPQKESELGPVPQSWDVVDFSQLREWLQYGTSARCTHQPTAYPVLRIPNIGPGRINALDMKFGTFTEAEAERYRLSDGDLIFIRTNGLVERLGACAVYAGEPNGALFASYLIRARLKLDRINPYYVAHFLGSELGTSIVGGRATPAADGKYNLNTGTIDSLPIPLPGTLEEQNEIVAVLDNIDRKIDLHRGKRAVLDQLFQALLRKLMTGEIRVADLDLSALESKQDASVEAA